VMEIALNQDHVCYFLMRSCDKNRENSRNSCCCVAKPSSFFIAILCDCFVRVEFAVHPPTARAAVA